ncbi:MAG: DUF488 domain-containing protein [Gammaproteobacteria bacterium]|nr:DUF488 domain-containing protein [Gammaproteobacteria bacterium]
MNDTLFTVGHSTHSTAHFIALLQRHGVDAVVDVRSVPHSAYNPQFNRDALQKSLRDNAIQYVFLGRELGARSDNPACYVDGKVQFKLLAAQPLFARGIERLRRGMAQYRVAIMCAEKDPLTCHRMILVCRRMRALASIQHILDDGALESHAHAERRLRDKLGIHADLLRDEKQSIEDAYDAQGERMGYAKKTPGDDSG